MRDRDARFGVLDVKRAGVMRLHAGPLSASPVVVAVGVMKPLAGVMVIADWLMGS
jgi:hypothetical protein